MPARRGRRAPRLRRSLPGGHAARLRQLLRRRCARHQRSRSKSCASSTMRADGSRSVPPGAPQAQRPPGEDRRRPRRMRSCAIEAKPASPSGPSSRPAAAMRAPSDSDRSTIAPHLVRRQMHHQRGLQRATMQAVAQFVRQQRSGWRREAEGMRAPPACAARRAARARPGPLSALLPPWVLNSTRQRKPARATQHRSPPLASAVFASSASDTSKARVFRAAPHRDRRQHRTAAGRAQLPAQPPRAGRGRCRGRSTTAGALRAARSRRAAATRPRRRGRARCGSGQVLPPGQRGLGVHFGRSRGHRLTRIIARTRPRPDVACPAPGADPRAALCRTRRRGRMSARARDLIARHAPAAARARRPCWCSTTPGRRCVLQRRQPDARSSSPVNRRRLVLFAAWRKPQRTASCACSWAGHADGSCCATCR